MSVSSVTTALPTLYGTGSGSHSRGVKYAAPVDPFKQDAAAADGAPVAGSRADGRSSNGTATEGADSADSSSFQNAFAKARRADGASAGKSASDASGSGSSTQSPAGIALYKRVSLIGNNESSPSALLKSWNSIVQGGGDDDGTEAATLQAFLQNGASGFGSGILDVTA
jgi:hypothetical protein